MLVLTEEVMKQIFISTSCIEALAIKYNSASISLFFCFSSLTIIMLTFSFLPPRCPPVYYHILSVSLISKTTFLFLANILMFNINKIPGLEWLAMTCYSLALLITCHFNQPQATGFHFSLHELLATRTIQSFERLQSKIDTNLQQSQKTQTF